MNLLQAWREHPRARRVLLGLGTVALCVAMVPLSGFRFLEDDSVLYGQMAGQLAQRPSVEWMTPQWPSGRWKSGNFEEHMAVFLWPPALLGSLGLPWMESILAVNFLYLFLAVVVAASFTRHRFGAEAAAVLPWVWLLAPGPVTYLLRGNHEPALALGIVVALWGVDRAEEDWAGVTAAVAGAVWCVAIKGVVGALVLPCLGLWWLLTGREPRRLATVILAGLGVVVFVAFYDSLYHYRTGRGFVETYLDIHMGYAREKEQGAAHAKVVNFAWYVAMAAWLVAPWSLVLARDLWLRARARTRPLPEVTALLACTLFVVLFLSMFDRRSVRYAFALVPFMALACAPSVLEGRPRARAWLARVSPLLPEAWMGAVVVATALRIYVHNNHYRYISTQGG